MPTDFSRNAFNAIAYALQLFEEETCTFYLVHTYTPAVYQAEYILHSPAQIGLGDMYQSQSMELLEELKEQLTGRYPNPNHTLVPHTAFNTVVDEIRDVAESEKADLIVMGTQGATGAQEILFGTHTVHVLKQVPCPVIVVPSGYDYEKPVEILFPTDFEVDYEELPMQPLFDIAGRHGSSLEVMYVSTGYDLSGAQGRNREKLEAMLADTEHVFHDLPNQEIITAINTFQQSNPVNFLVMVRNKHTFLERLFIEPVVKKIAFHVTIPFMVIPG